MNLRTLSHEDFLRHAYMQAASGLEREMLRRLEAPGFDQDLLDEMLDGTLDAQKVREFMSLLVDYGIETPEDLRATLDRGFAYLDVIEGYGVEFPDDLISILERNLEQKEA